MVVLILYYTATAEYDTKSQDDECKCVDLPTGEKICDPIDCQLTIKLESILTIIITTIQVMKTRRDRMKSANA